MKYFIFIFAALTCSTVMAQSKGSSGGRFQVLQLSSMRRDQVLIDTQTGKMWHSVCFVSPKNGEAGDCSYSAWMADDVEGISKSKEAIYKEAREYRELVEKPDEEKK